jgi:hypothetical protein
MTFLLAFTDTVVAGRTVGPGRSGASRAGGTSPRGGRAAGSPLAQRLRRTLRVMRTVLPPPLTVTRSR